MLLKEGDVIQLDINSQTKTKFLVEQTEVVPPYKNQVASYNSDAQRIVARRLGLDDKYDTAGEIITFHTTQGWTDYISSFQVIGHMTKYFM